MKKGLIVGVAALLSVAAASTSQAHHSTSLYVDVSKVVSVTGTFEELKFINPHALVKFYAPDKAGKMVLWSAETHGPSALARVGWRPAMFHKGEKITVMGNPSRDGSAYIQLTEVIFVSDNFHLSPAKNMGVRKPA